jgi:hypothetical protein
MEIIRFSNITDFKNQFGEAFPSFRRVVVFEAKPTLTCPEGSAIYSAGFIAEARQADKRIILSRSFGQIAGKDYDLDKAQEDVNNRALSAAKEDTGLVENGAKVFVTRFKHQEPVLSKTNKAGDKAFDELMQQISEREPSFT